MEASMGESYARSWAHDVHLDALAGQTVDQALSDGVSAQVVWRAVCQEVEVLAVMHEGPPR